MIEVVHEVLYDGGLQPIVDDLDFAVIGSGWQQSDPLVFLVPQFTPSDAPSDLTEPAPVVATEVGRYDDPIIIQLQAEVMAEGIQHDLSPITLPEMGRDTDLFIFPKQEFVVSESQPPLFEPIVIVLEEVGRYTDPVIFMLPPVVFSESLFIDQVEPIGSGWWADQPIVEPLPPFYPSTTEAPLLDIVLLENAWAEAPPIIILEPFVYFDLQAADFAEVVGAAPPGGKITIVIVTDAGEGLAVVGSIGLGGAIILDTGLGDATLLDRGISDALEP